MKKIILSLFLLLLTILATTSADAQFTFTKLTQAYTKLTGATSLTQNTLWTSDDQFTAPLGFNFRMNGTVIDKIYLSAGNFAASTKNTPKQSGFMVLGTGLMDRGAAVMQPRSDIRYQTTGAAGSRVFRLEVYNAGFEGEFSNFGELKDSVSFQLWLYEGTNVAEFHYGDARVSNFEDYFGTKLTCGFLKNMDTAAMTFDKFYVPVGSGGNYQLDSMTSFFNPKGLLSLPAAGTVFRFTPKGSTATAVSQVAPSTLARVYPTQVHSAVTLEHHGPNTLEYTIISSNGVLITSGEAAPGMLSVDLSTVSPGTYFLRLADVKAGQIATQPIIKL